MLSITKEQILRNLERKRAVERAVAGLGPVLNPRVWRRTNTAIREATEAGVEEEKLVEAMQRGSKRGLKIWRRRRKRSQTG